MARTGNSVTAAVAAGFGSCLVAVALLVAWATDAAFDQEQRRAEESLEAVAASQAGDFGTLFDSAVPLIEDLAAHPGLATHDPAECDAALAPFASVTGQARVAVVDAAGDTVCGLAEDGGAGVVPAHLYELALQGELAVTDAGFVDATSEHPAVAVSTPVTGPDGAVIGAVVVILFTDVPAPVLDAGVAEETVVVVVDPRSGLVLSATDGAPYAPGGEVDWTRPPARGDDGVDRIWRVVDEPQNGWTVAVGLDREVALAAANNQRRSLLLFGVAILGLVVVLAVSLQRRLARPIRRLGSAIAASRRGDEEVRAPEAGPSEIVEVACAFNELVDAHQELTQRLRRNARHDSLTGLLNRRGVTEELVGLMEDPKAAPLWVLFIDLDRFKLVNDSHGHAVGDQLLVALAERIQATVPPEWIVSRFGGDEFVILCPRTADPTPAVEGLGEVLRSTIRVATHDLQVGGSTGIARARSGQSVDDLIREADTAMYRAKELGRGGHAVFDDEMRAWTLARLSTESQLRGAAERGELVAYHQPIIEVGSGAVIGTEALVRWQHPTRGFLPPGEFIPIAEETDLVLEIGSWMLQEAAVQAAAWRAAGTPVRVSVNVAAAQLLRTDLVATVGWALSRAGALPSDLMIEVTESAVLSDVEATVVQLEAVRRLGVQVALDDFGTGFSSLSYLQRLPADELKIDRSFVSLLGEDLVSETIVASVINLAHAVTLDVVAEGVETEEQLAILRRLGCDRAQGYHLGRPVPVADLDLTRIRAVPADLEPPVGSVPLP